MQLFFLSLIIPIFSWANFLSIKDFENENSANKALIFLSETCPCSNSHIEHLNSLAKSYPQIKYFAVISEKARPENEKELAEYFSQKNFKFPVIQDNEQVLVKKYDALKTPHATLLSKNGSDGSYKVVYQGGVTNAANFNAATIKYLEENLKLISENKPVKYDKGISQGCYILR